MVDIIQVHDLKVSFSDLSGTKEVLKGVSFRIPQGETVALVGESGSGKSVTAQAIMGLLPDSATITQGKIEFCDPDNQAMTAAHPRSHAIDLSQLPPKGRDYRGIRGDRISMIFQEPMTSLSPLHTIGNQIQEALRLHRHISKKQACELVIETLRLVGFPMPEKAMCRYPFELSGGLRQRAMIAMALVCRPALLIADEPTTALDVTIQAQILKLIAELQTELNMAVLMITHDLGVVANIANEVVVMYHGKIVEAGTAHDLFTNPQHPYLQGLKAAVPHFGMKTGERLIALREIDTSHSTALFQKEKIAPANREAPILSVQNLSKSFTGRSDGGFLGFGGEKHTIKAVNEVNFDIKRGSCLGLVGESGCGKSTLSKLIMGQIKPSQGSVIFEDELGDHDFAAMNEDAMRPFRRKVQYVFQDPFSSLNPRMTVFDILTEPLKLQKIGTHEDHKETAKNLMQLVGLPLDGLWRYPHSFSGGQRQRIGIARALVLKPDLIICDEPVSALDVSVQAQILNLFKDLQEKLGLTYLFISHNLAVVDYIADDIAVMCAGRLVEKAPKEILFDNPRHPYTQALLAAVPYADLDRPLDFAFLENNRASEPDAWPLPFGTHPEWGEAALTEVEKGHYVRMHPVAIEEKAS